jgi:NitT/TauT family transport system substrate-binding protein
VVNKNKTKKFIKIRLKEVAHSIFYAPMYTAINQGFFAEEGLEIDLSTVKELKIYATGS